MSYARFLESDVYVFLDIGGFYSCCACSIYWQTEEWDKSKFYTTADLIKHLKEHEEKGDYVPQYCYDRLEEEREENDKWIEEERKKRKK